MELKLSSNTILFATIILFSISCTKSITGSEPGLTDSLTSVEDVQLITGGENVTITVNRNHAEAYFNTRFSNVITNKVVENGTFESWCIDWQKPIDSNNGSYNSIKLYSTDLVEKWKPLNYLLNIKKSLKEKDPELTWRDFQIAVWSLRANPEFNLNNISVEDLPSSFRTVDGKANFNHEKVNEILKIVENGHKDFNFSAGTKFAVIAETPADIQTVFVVVEKR